MAPMLHASMHGHVEIVRALLAQSKVLVNPENDDGLSAFLSPFL